MSEHLRFTALNQSRNVDNYTYNWVARFKRSDFREMLENDTDLKPIIDRIEHYHKPSQDELPFQSPATQTLCIARGVVF